MVVVGFFGRTALPRFWTYDAYFLTFDTVAVAVVGFFWTYEHRTTISGVEPRCRLSKFYFRCRTSLSLVELRFLKFKLQFSALSLVVDCRTSISGVEPRCRLSKFDFRCQTSISGVKLYCRLSKSNFRRRSSI